MFVFIAMSVCLFLKPNKPLAITYGVFSFFMFLGFIAIGGGLLYEKNQVRPMFDDLCRNKSSEIHYVDKLYAVANADLCSVTCSCDADKT